ncbi:PRD domain-containing protein [Neobacillus pocheonensis]|uniref:PRD domain-containing protein n=1 Tax=Neobacillus pocheonensis TaxID=363869 RepID=UPI003D2A54FF
MDRVELKERLELLLPAGVISEKAADITTRAFENLASIMNKTDILQSEMLFTHLPSALTRLEKGEKIEGPPEAFLDEVKEAGFMDLVEKEINFIEKEFEMILPIEEKNYLLLHYTSVFQQNLIGTKA